jgi:hypothetical protein
MLPKHNSALGGRSIYQCARSSACPVVRLNQRLLVPTIAGRTGARGCAVEGRAGPVVDIICDGGQVLGGVHWEIGVLEELVAQVASPALGAWPSCDLAWLTTSERPDVGHGGSSLAAALFDQRS